MATVKLVFVGDSNTQYVDAPYGDIAALVDNHLTGLFPATTFTTVNRGVGGSSSVQAMDDITNVLAQNPNIIVFLHGGTNDSYYDYNNTPGPYTLPEYQTRLESYITQVAAYNNGSAQLNGRPLLVFVTAPGAADVGEGFQYDRNRPLLEQYVQKMRDVATARGVPRVEYYTASTTAPNWRTLYLTDGVHVNQACKSLIPPLLASAIAPYQAADGSLLTVPAVTINAVTSPTTTGTQTITGTVTGESVTVTVNGQSVSVVAGAWSYNATLVSGVNTFTVVATNAAGSDTESASIDYQPPVAAVDLPDLKAGDGTAWKDCDLFAGNGTTWVPVDLFSGNGTSWQ